jgi:hypothetical protein
MRYVRTQRGFEQVLHDYYPPQTPVVLTRLVQQSSVVGNYEDAMERPGSSALWLGENHHLSREEVAELRDRLTLWLATGSLRLQRDPDEDQKPGT